MLGAFLNSKVGKLHIKFVSIQVVPTLSIFFLQSVHCSSPGQMDNQGGYQEALQ